MDIIEVISKIVIPIAGILITAFLIPYIKSKTTKNQRDMIYGLVKIGVNAAEQTAKLNGLDTGKKKKEYVLKFINDMGLKITEDELDNMIESAVKELKLAEKEWVKPEIVYNISTEDYKELGD